MARRAQLTYHLRMGKSIKNLSLGGREVSMGPWPVPKRNGSKNLATRSSEMRRVNFSSTPVKRLSFRHRLEEDFGRLPHNSSEQTNKLTQGCIDILSGGMVHEFPIGMG